MWRRVNAKHKYYVLGTMLDSTFTVSYFHFNSLRILKEKPITITYKGTTLDKLLPTDLHKTNERGR